MKLETLGQVIAVRKLKLMEDPVGAVFVQLGKPQPFPDSKESDDSYCPYQITGAGDERVRYAGGVDAFQAIELALKMIAADLAHLNRGLNGRLRWECDESGGLGFAVFPEG